MTDSKPHRKRPAPLCQYLRSLTIENVRTFRQKTVLDFCFPDGHLAQWTVLLGENGAGKTTLLQYIAGLLPQQETRGDAAMVKDPASGKEAPGLRPMAASSEWLMWHAANLPRPWSREKPNRLGAKVELSRPATTLKAAKPIPKSWIGKPEMPAHEYGYAVTFGQSSEGRAHVELQMTIPASLDFFEQFPLFAYGATRHIAGPSSPYVTSDHFFRNGGNSPVNTIFNDDQPLLSPEQWLLSLDHLQRTEGSRKKSARHVLAQAKACLCGVLPEVSAIHIRPFGITGEETRMTVMFETSFGAIPFGALSLGYRTMAGWLVDFLRRMYERYADRPKPHECPAILLIDELDLHLHPRWQLQAMTVIGRQFPNTQFIVTVHSPLTVQAADGHANLALLRRVKTTDGHDSEIVDNDPAYARGWRLDQLVTSDLFGWPSPRSKTFARLVKRRVALLQKENLLDKEREELRRLTERLTREAPTGPSPATQWLEKATRQRTRAAQ